MLEFPLLAGRGIRGGVKFYAASQTIGIRNFQIKKYPNYFLWDGLLARPYPERAGELTPQNWRIYFL
jgi:hypothetical protein